MKFKKVGILSLTALLTFGGLAGCSTTKTPDTLAFPTTAANADGTLITPTVLYEDYENLFGQISTEGQKLLQDTYEQFYGTNYKYYGAQTLPYVGKLLPETKATDINGNEFTIGGESTKGKKVIISFVQSLCSYCIDEAKEMEEFLKTQDDVLKVKLFVGNYEAYEGGTKDNAQSVAAFLTESGTTGEAYDHIGVYNDNTSDMLSLLGGGTPATVFLDETGRITWVLNGATGGTVLKAVAKKAFGETKLYNTLPANFDGSKYLLTLDQVAEFIGDERLEDAGDLILSGLTQAGLIKEAELEMYTLEGLLLYIGRELPAVKVINSQGVEVDLASLKGQKIMLELITTENKDLNKGIVADAKKSVANSKEIQEKADANDIVTLQVWYGSEKYNKGTDYIKANKLESAYDYVIDIASQKTSVAEELSLLAQYCVPMQFYIDEDFKIAGVTMGTLDGDLFAKAVSTYLGEKAFYEK